VHSLTLGANSKFVYDVNLKSFECLDEIYVSPDNPYYEAEDGIIYNKGKTEIIDFAATHVFENDTYLIPDTVVNISAPIRCSNIKSYAVSDTNPNYSTVDGLLTSKNGTKLISYPYGRVESVCMVPDGIKTIGESSFYGTKIEYVILSESVTSIEKTAFQYSSLKGIEMTSSINYIASYAFRYCGIQYLDLPSMSGCAESKAINSSVKVIKLPVGSEFSLPDEAFEGSNTKIIYGDETEGEISASGMHGTFEWKISNYNLIITGNGAIDACEAGAYPWSEHEYYRVIFWGENISVPEYAFSGISNLCILEMNNSVVSIGDEAFYNCNALCFVKGHENVSFIGNKAFEGTLWLNVPFYHASEDADGLAALGTVVIKADDNAETVRISDRITYIADDAFSSCKNIRTICIPRSSIEFPEGSFTNSADVESVLWNDTGEAVTLYDLQKTAAECKQKTITTSTGEKANARVIFSDDHILNFISMIGKTPYVESLSMEYCQNIIDETGINSEMTDEELIRVFFDYLMENTYYSFAYIEDNKGIHSADGKSVSLSTLYTHLPSGLAILQTGVCSSYSGLFLKYASLLSEKGISTTINAYESFGLNHQWNVICLDKGTENERWYYHDASNGQCLIGYENPILKNNPEMFAYDGSVPENEDGTYTITLQDGSIIRLQGEDAYIAEVRGDTDGDGIVSISDAVLVLKIYAQNAAGLVPDAGDSDIDGDGAVRIEDATAILSYYAMNAAGMHVSWNDILNKAE
ncbi:MAG: leucine-rich repeat protein, partial [Oscillospiraceae bacterium]|nr:leucine-rich repeat protein [Oscillospiraceae bacterium]